MTHTIIGSSTIIFTCDLSVVKRILKTTINYNLISNNAHVLARTMLKRSCTLDEYFVTKRRQVEEEDEGENEVDLFSNEVVNDYSANESNDSFSSEVTIGDSANDLLGNEIATGDNAIEQQLDNKRTGGTVNDKVSYTKNF